MNSKPMGSIVGSVSLLRSLSESYVQQRGRVTQRLLQSCDRPIQEALLLCLKGANLALSLRPEARTVPVCHLGGTHRSVCVLRHFPVST